MTTSSTTAVRELRPRDLPNPLCEDLTQNPDFRRGRLTFLIVVGGCAGDLMYQSRLIGDAAAYLDNRNEVSQPGLHPGAFCLPIARGTIDELLERIVVPESVRDFLKSLAAANKLDAGLGQWRKLGLLAGIVLQREGTFDSLFDQVFEYLARKHGGDIEEIEIIVISSQAGGTGSSLAVLAAETAERVMVSRTAVPVTTVMIRVGAASYIGCGPRVELNRAAALPEDVQWFSSPARHQRASRKLVLLELPLAGTKKGARDRAASATGQAVHSAALQAAMALAQINWALRSPLSGITLIKPGFWCEVSQARIAADVARSLAPRIRDLVAAPPRPEVVSSIEIDVETEEGHLPSAQSLASAALDNLAKPQQFEDRVRTRPSYSGNVRIRLTGDCGVFASDGIDGDGTLEAFLAQPVTTEEACRQRLQLLGGLIQRLGGEMDDRRRLLLGCQQSAKLAEALLARSIDRLWPVSWGAWLAQCFVGRRERASAFEAAISHWRQCQNKASRIEFELCVLQQVANHVVEIKSALAGRLNDLVVFGEDQVVDHADSSSLVTVGSSLDGVLRRLAVWDQLTPDAITQVLGGAVESVTMAGLAAIVGASSARPEAIIRKLQAGPILTAPWYGMGLGPATNGVTAILLPKLAPGISNALSTAILAIDANLELLESTAVVGAPSVVQLDIRPAGRVDDLFTPQVMTALKAIKANPQMWLAPDTTVDFARFPRYGIDIEGLCKSIHSSDESKAA